MPVYSIAGIKVFMEPRFERTAGQSEKYKIEGAGAEDADMVISYPDRIMERWQEKAPGFDKDSCEYMGFASSFYSGLIRFNGIMLHASAVVYDGKAYLFSAPSGTGKSTHTRLWLKYFGEDRAYILNDDKPAIRKAGGIYYACGTPFSGKVDMSRNEMVPLQAICVLKRGTENSIRLLGNDDALYGILNQTLRPSAKQNMMDMLDIVDDILKNIPVYELRCDISEEAVRIAYERMKG